jgi:hypothetical protein
MHATITQASIEDDRLSRAVIRIQSSVLALVGAMLGGMSLFIATIWLVIKDGENVGAHLGLLSHYFIGYSVTWTGSVFGLCYGALVGGVFGWTIGFIYNWVLKLRHH